MAQAGITSLQEYRSRQLIEDGKYHISVSDLDLARECFERSVESYETAEGLTLLGWVLHLQGKLEQAIALCRRAIALDPDFGNPLNDLGSYLMQKHLYDEAIPILEKAKAAAHYEPRHFPYINLGRIYSALGRIDEAIVEFRGALAIVPDHREVRNVLIQLEEIQASEN